MDLQSFSQLLHEINEKFTSIMQAFDDLSTRKVNSITNNDLTILTPMIQKIKEQQEMIDQMLAKRASQQEESTSNEDEDDPFIPLDFSNIEGCPHEL